MKCFVYKRKRKDASGCVRLSRTWYGCVRLPGEPERRLNLGVTDKQVAREKLREHVRDLERERAGVVVPRPLREAAAVSMTLHLADVVADLKARGCREKYYRLVDARVRELIAACSWSLPRDVTADSFVAWRSRREATAAAKTLNHFLDAAMVVMNWMKRQGRILANPLQSVEKVKSKGREKVKRRSLTSGEVQRLLDVSGEYRATYLMAVMTGFRRSELKAIVPADLHLDAVRPFVLARESTTKNSRKAPVYLRGDVVGELRALLLVKKRRRGLLRLPKTDAFRSHLRAAGIAEFDSLGRKVDFHALRHTYGTHMALAGVQPRVAMEAMRHSDMKLTMNIYTDAGKLPVADVMDQLPRYDLASPAVVLATGTDGDMIAAPGTPGMSPDAGKWTPKRTPGGTPAVVGGGHFVTSAVTDVAVASSANGPRIVAESASEDAPCRGAADVPFERGRRGSNPQPPDRQSGALTN